jgi:hypothetical protein
MMRRRLDVRVPDRERGRRSGPALVSLALHVAVVVLILRTISVPVMDFLTRTGDGPVEERVVYVEPKAERPVEAPPPPPPQRRTDLPPTRSDLPPREGAALPVLPTVTPPTGGGQVTSGVPLPLVTGDGRQVFGSGLPGLSTGRVDPRLVTPPDVVDGPARNRTLSPDVYVDAWVAAFWDSIARVQAERPRAQGDWTVERDGKKFGMDPGFIYFGKFKLPTALLALLPINVQANPGAVERNRALASMKYEIDFQAQRAANEAEFRKAVDELRARRERERAQKQLQAPTRAGVSGGRVPPER